MASTKKRPAKHAAKVQGNVFLQANAQQSFSSAQVQLLQAVAECGSISSAAKQVGISYKTAWDRIDAINNLSDQPLVATASGGAKGGGTTLTDYGKKIVEGFSALEREHTAFINRIGNDTHSFGDIANFIKSGIIMSSARNQYRGTIKSIHKGAVNADVELAINEEQTIIAQITVDSVKQLGLKRGKNVVALVNSHWIILSKDTNLATSARNKLIGTVERIVKGAVNTEAILALGEGKSICATITNTSVKDLKLKVGDQACAIFKASSVILMVD